MTLLSHSVPGVAFQLLRPERGGGEGQGLTPAWGLYEHLLCIHPAGHLNGVFFLYPVPSFLTHVLITYKSGNDEL